jgi:hypothetical protein
MLPAVVYGIVGSREWTDYEILCARVDDAIRMYGPPAAFVSGGATGADRQGELYAMDRYGFPVVVQKHDCEGMTAGAMNVFLPEWKGPDDKTAGLKRNTLIAKHCHVLIAFPTESSRGTYDTIRKAKARGKIVIE